MRSLAGCGLKMKMDAGCGNGVTRWIQILRRKRDLLSLTGAMRDSFKTDDSMRDEKKNRTAILARRARDRYSERGGMAGLSQN